jgi:hypothetical protein
VGEENARRQQDRSYATVTRLVGSTLSRSGREHSRTAILTDHRHRPLTSAVVGCALQAEEAA